MELCETGTLSDLIEAKKKFDLKITEEQIWKIISQFCIALAVMNSKGIAHRDVKDSNIFIDKNHNLKLGLNKCRIVCIIIFSGDFGLSKMASFDSQRLNTMLLGTVFADFLFIIIR
jgi:serine/threonine protein kinase